MCINGLFADINWESWSPREDVCPKFEKRGTDNNLQLSITSSGNFNNYGVWICYVHGIHSGGSYKFSVEYSSKNIETENESVYAILSWIDVESKTLQRDYVDNVYDLEDRWKCLYRIIDAPSGAIAMKVELGLRWTKSGCVIWRRPSVILTQSVQRRKVKVATTYMEAKSDFTANLENMINIVELAGKAGADIVCLTETYYNCFIDLPLVKLCQTIPGEITELISEKARLYNIYVILSMYEKDGESIYNTAVLIGRRGEIIGKYRKMHIPLYEGESGVTPGKECCIFDTDFGRIGIMVCWDQVFPEVARRLSLMGAEIIFLPTLGDEPLQQMARAKDNGLHLVVAGMNGPESSRIITPRGEVAGTVRDVKEGIYITEIDLDQKYYTYWLSVGACKGEHKSLFKKELRNLFLTEENTL